MSTTTQIFLDTQGTKEGVRDIKVRKHFQFHHLVGDVQKGLGIHIFQFSGFFYALNTSINYKTMFVNALFSVWKQSNEYWLPNSSQLSNFLNELHACQTWSENWKDHARKFLKMDNIGLIRHLKTHHRIRYDFEFVEKFSLKLDWYCLKKMRINLNILIFWHINRIIEQLSIVLLEF